jgi:adenylosuccinate synthase
MYAVIGSGFGDEAKGLVTNYLAKDWVVRFSGGAQAGHTVVHNGTRHVFHHFGAGTLKGARTYLDEAFIVNPFQFVHEYHELTDKRVWLGQKVWVHPDCLVTTPYDMLVNQILEKARGAGRHGSCGFGINETILRSRTFPLRAKNLPLITEDTLITCAELARTRLLSMDVDTVELDEYSRDINNIRIFISVCQTMAEMIEIGELALPPSTVFEGSQGLLLDMDHPFFPHVTHAHTGTTNIARYLGPADEVIYVTRPYLTRHGAGPFPSECPQLSFNDATNQPNPHQGTLRFGHFDLGLWQAAIHKDCQTGCRRALGVTCLDQVGSVSVYDQGLVREYGKREFIDLLCRTIPFDKIYLFANETDPPKILTKTR